jgi:hypothetical protein
MGLLWQTGGSLILRLPAAACAAGRATIAVRPVFLLAPHVFAMLMTTLEEQLQRLPLPSSWPKMPVMASIEVAC